MSTDDLTFIKQIGSGDFMVIYLTSKKDDNSYYITKIINKGEQYSNSKRCINNDINILIDLNHPNILKLYEIRETKENNIL